MLTTVVEAEPTGLMFPRGGSGCLDLQIMLVSGSMLVSSLIFPCMRRMRQRDREVGESLPASQNKTDWSSDETPLNNVEAQYDVPP